jgi:hypothetical protein
LRTEESILNIPYVSNSVTRTLREESSELRIEDLRIFCFRMFGVLVRPKRQNTKPRFSTPFTYISDITIVISSTVIIHSIFGTVSETFYNHQILIMEQKSLSLTIPADGTEVPLSPFEQAKE